MSRVKKAIKIAINLAYLLICAMIYIASTFIVFCWFYINWAHKFSFTGVYGVLISILSMLALIEAIRDFAGEVKK